MSNMISDAQAEIIRLEKMLKKIDDFLSHAPEGCLKWQHRNAKTYYYQQCKKESKWDRKYITNENIALAKELAQKQYYIVLKRLIDRRLKALIHLTKTYPTKEIETIYDAMSDERKVFVEPIEMTLKERVKIWNEEAYERNSSFPENLRYETEQGDIVRSKSEVIIANLLYQHKQDILYKYERPLEIIENGCMKTIYPDFTILNMHTGKITYWEHAGIMDEPQYSSEFVKKMNTYVANELLPGRDIVISFETSLNPLDIRVVKQLIHNLIL